MFTAEDFDLSLEEQLKLRVITDEIEKCSNVDQLQKELKAATALMMRYQHILHRLLKEKIEENLSEFIKEMKASDNS